MLHLTTAHPPTDVRIYEKECKSLVATGYDVTIAAQGSSSGTTADSPRIHGLPTAANRFQRFTRTWLAACWLALTGDYRVYHMHDPDAIPIGLLAKLRGRIVIFDVHEDLPNDILTKYWIPRPLRRLVAWVAACFERLAGLAFDGIVVATPSIGRRFPASNTTLVQNFPRLSEVEPRAGLPYLMRPPTVVYVGAIQQIRGAFQVIEALDLFPASSPVSLTIAGSFETNDLQRSLTSLPGWSRAHYLGWVPRSTVLELMGRARAGLVTFLPAPNHVDAQPNKLFEYMAAGIPVIASNFALWRELVEGIGCGLLVDPTDPAAIANAITWVIEHPELSAAMGARGREAIYANLNWEREAEKLIRLYDELIG